MALDANEDWVYFRIGKEAARRIQPGRTVMGQTASPRAMLRGAGAFRVLQP